MTLAAGRSTPDEPEVGVCPHCFRPFQPGAGYCTHCGSGLGIAETQIQPIPIPNSPRYSERHEPGAPVRRRSWVRAVAVFWCVAVIASWSIWLLIVLVGGPETLSLTDTTRVSCAVLGGAAIAGFFSYRRSRRASASGEHIEVRGDESPD